MSDGKNVLQFAGIQDVFTFSGRSTQSLGNFVKVFMYSNFNFLSLGLPFILGLKRMLSIGLLFRICLNLLYTRHIWNLKIKISDLFCS